MHSCTEISFLIGIHFLFYRPHVVPQFHRCTLQPIEAGETYICDHSGRVYKMVKSLVSYHSTLGNELRSIKTKGVYPRFVYNKVLPTLHLFVPSIFLLQIGHEIFGIFIQQTVGHQIIRTIAEYPKTRKTSCPNMSDFYF